MIDNKGRILGRVSIVDILIVLAVIALAVGLLYRGGPAFTDMLRPTDEFYVTFEVRRMRGLVVEGTVREGDVVFRQHERRALGTVVDVELIPATDILLRTDGTAMLAPAEQRYNLRITIAATGRVTDAGFFINGVDHVAPGREVALINNRIIYPFARVYSITERVGG